MNDFEDTMEMLKVIAEMNVELESINYDVLRIRQHLAVLQAQYEDELNELNHDDTLEAKLELGSMLDGLETRLKASALYDVSTDQSLILAGSIGNK